MNLSISSNTHTVAKQMIKYFLEEIADKPAIVDYDKIELEKFLKAGDELLGDAWAYLAKKRSEFKVHRLRAIMAKPTPEQLTQWLEQNPAFCRDYAGKTIAYIVETGEVVAIGLDATVYREVEKRGLWGQVAVDWIR